MCFACSGSGWGARLRPQQRNSHCGIRAHAGKKRRPHKRHPGGGITSIEEGAFDDCTLLEQSCVAAGHLSVKSYLRFISRRANRRYALVIELAGTWYVGIGIGFRPCSIVADFQ